MDERAAAAANATGAGRTSHWLAAYLALAALYVVTVVSGLYLHRRLLDLHDGTVRISRAWADRMAALEHLGLLANEVADPVNEVFQTGDADTGRDLLMRALAPFTEQLEQVRADLTTLAAGAVAEEQGALRGLLADLDDIDHAIDGMIQEAERTFSFYRLGQTDKAGELMGRMNQRRAALSEGMAVLHQNAIRIVEARLAERALRGERMALVGHALNGIVLLLVLPIGIYGARLWRDLERDRKERGRQLAALAASEERKTAILVSSLDPVVTVDAGGRVTEFNPAAESTFGYRRDEVLGRDLAEVVAPPSLREAHRASIARFARPDGERVVGFRRETNAMRRDGSEFPVEVAVASFHFEGEQHLAIFMRDIGDRKRYEQDLLAAKEAAEAATRAKSEFLANMSHEIRTPMNAVIGMTGLLLETEMSDEQREFTETVRSSSDALLAIINDILDFSKIESGHLELERQPFDLRDCVEDAIGLVAVRAAEKGLELVYEIAAGVPAAVVGDVTRVRQVLANLLSNAVKFTEKGEVVVSVEPGPRLGDDGVEVRFAVIDTGMGIPADRMDRLFRSFSQVDASTTRRFGGTGLGLAISKRLVEMMGGRMEVTSSAGEGSRFAFTIVAEPAPSRRQVHPAELEKSLNGLRLLVVDDNATNRRILGLQAESWGMRPRLAASGLEALECLARGEVFDVAVLDMHMPEMDGATLAREIRRSCDARSLPLILLSSAGSFDGGAGDLFAAALAKPVKSSRLFDALVEAIAGPRATPRTRSAMSRAKAPKLALRLPLRILLAEDNAVNQRVALRMLEHMGYRADVAANGIEVLEALARQRYDVVLLDVQMPQMDGLEAARRIGQRWAPGLRPRLVAMTANAMQGDREACLAAGMDDYIAKPVSLATLEAALERAAPPELDSAAAGG